MALPLALELGGFIFLAAGLAPRRRKVEAVTLDLQAEPVKVIQDHVAKAERARDAKGRFLPGARLELPIASWAMAEA
jgi:hypothetical protein